jgi:hypothetical protein
MDTATNAWPHAETDPQRQALLVAADRLLAGTPRHSTGALSVVQLAIEAQVKYWIVAQKHTDLRDHFQQLTAHPGKIPIAFRDTLDAHDTLVEKHAELRHHCANLEQLVTLYATALNELALENKVLREQAAEQGGTVTSLRLSTRRQPHQQP